MDPATASLAGATASFASPSVLSGVALTGTALNAFGQVRGAQATAGADKFNASVADANANIARQNALWAGEEGEQSAANSELRTRAQVGGIKANQGASGVEVGTGSNAAVVESASELGKLDAMTIRSNAARRAYGFQVEAASDTAQAAMDRAAASNARKGGIIGAAGTLLGGSAQALAYNNYLQSKSVL